MEHNSFLPFSSSFRVLQKERPFASERDRTDGNTVFTFLGASPLKNRANGYDFECLLNAKIRLNL